MSVQVINSEARKSRKRRRCTWCGEWIEAGEAYIHERVIVEGDPSTNDLHPECSNALDELVSYEGGSCTYTPYENERPAHSASADNGTGDV